MDGAASRLRRLAELQGRAHALLAARLRDGTGSSPLDPELFAPALAELRRSLEAHPERLQALQARWRQDMAELWARQLGRTPGAHAAPLIEPEPGDRRFKDPAWTDEPFFDLLKQSYLLTARLVRDTVAAAELATPAARQAAAFYARQVTAAAAPVNHLAANPAALREAAATGGQSLLDGLERLLADLERTGSGLEVSTARPDAFRLGAELAATPGQVVFENELMQLIQYAPTTKRVHRRPLLMVPAWINKFYILDLRPESSLVRYAVARGHTVFMISWVNPGPEHAAYGFPDYLRLGPLAAIDAIAAATGEREVNLLGHCIGGTLSTCALAMLAARAEPRVASATLLTTLTDFAEPGEIGIFTAEPQLARLERHMAERGYLAASSMRQLFSLLRPSELIWSFVVNNYLMGRDPPAFDLLHWNADGTRLPAALHGFCLRELYQRNRLALPGGLVLDGIPIDLGQVRVPAYILAAEEDHIAPWRGVHRSGSLLGGRVRHVVAGSGHVAGVVNPPERGRYVYRTGRQRADPDAWRAAATARPGSWWPDWTRWLARHGGGKVPARTPGDGALPPIEPAPGRYVRVQTVD